MSLSPFPIFDSVVAEQRFDPRTIKHRDPDVSKREHRDWYTSVTLTMRNHTPEEVTGRLNELRKQGVKPNKRTQQVGGRPKAKPRVPTPRQPSE